eukprot:2570395-Amphidinium_carterae.1
MTHTVANTMNWLIATAEDEQQPAEIRVWCMRIALIAPRLLWPAPMRTSSSSKLKPNARPLLVKQRLSLLHSGRWGDLLAEAMMSNVGIRPNHAAHNPGTITPQAAKALVSAAREGRIGPAWKQLWSHGVAPHSEDTAEAVQRKWSPAPATALPAITPSPPTETAEAVTSQKQWLLALRKLKKGTAADAAGWTTEIFVALAAFPATSGHFRQLVKRQMIGTLREDEMRCMGAIHVLALNKNGKGDIRPISVPSVWRKLLSSMIVASHSEAAARFLGTRQHGIGTPNGISRFAKRVAELAVASPHHLFLQTDISNAFGMVHRSSVLDALLQCDESLAACSRSWLSREATGYIQIGQKRQRIVSARGLQQGDPLSAMAFSLVMESALRDLEARLRRQSIEVDFNTFALAYIDDTVLSMPQHTAEAVITTWQDCLDSVGLHLNVDKTILYQPQDEEPVAPTLIPLWRTQPRHDGLIICGLPVWSDPMEQPSTAVPCGSLDFITEFLNLQKTAVRRRLEAACALAEAVEEDHGGQHVALHIIRLSVLAMHVHLLRALHPDRTQAWASVLDGLVRDSFTRITDIPVSATDDLYSYPAAEAGLGFTSLRREAATHYIAQLLSERHAAQDPHYVWTPEDQRAFHLYELTAGVSISAACAVASDALAHSGRRKAVKILRVPLYKEMANPHFCTPSPASMMAVPGARSIMQRAALCWFHTPRGMFMLNQALRTALRIRLALPLMRPSLT